MPLDNYNIQRSAKDGHCAYCRECQREYNKTKRTPAQKERYQIPEYAIALREYQQKWRGANRERLRVQAKAKMRRVREEVIGGYGGKCSCCGIDKYEFLCIDHVNGGGGRERKTFNSQQLLYKLRKEGFPSSHRVLCHNCNMAFAREPNHSCK